MAPLRFRIALSATLSMALPMALPMLLLASAPSIAEEAPRVQTGSVVEISYVMRSETGEVIGSSEENENMVFEQGAREVPPGLEVALEGLAVGDEKSVTLGPEEGFGPVDESLFHRVALEQVPEEGRTKGTRLMARDPQGNPHVMRVHEVGEEEIVLDLNHPLAGRTIQFEVEVVSIGEKAKRALAPSGAAPRAPSPASPPMPSGKAPSGTTP